MRSTNLRGRRIEHCTELTFSEPMWIKLPLLILTYSDHKVTFTNPKLTNIHIGSEKVSTVHCSVSRLSRFVLRMRAILLLCQSVGHFTEVLK